MDPNTPIDGTIENSTTTAQAINPPVINLPQNFQEQNPVTSTQSPSTQGQYAGSSSWAIILMLFSLPPIAWIMIWKTPKFHSWFYKWLFVYGAISLILSITQFMSNTQTIMFYRRMGLPAPSHLDALALAGVFCALIQIFFGIYLRQKFQHSKPSIFDAIASCFLITIPFFILNMLSLIALLFPLYNFSPQNMPDIQQLNQVQNLQHLQQLQ